MKLPRCVWFISHTTRQYQLNKCRQNLNRFLCTGANRGGATGANRGGRTGANRGGRTGANRGGGIGANRGGAMDPEEAQHFRRLADKWWSYNGVFQPLHSMNILRVPFIRDALLPYSASSSDSRPLEGLDILDVGCGGGLLSEPLARLGANVTGIDLVSENVNAATAHASRDPSLRECLMYQHCSVNDLLAEKTGHYDAVVMSEVIEHITNKEEVVQPCSALLKESGSIFITTINKTMMSQLLAVYAVENLLSIVPKGTHDWDKFIEPEEMKNILKLNNCHTYLIHGMQFNPITNQWSWTSDTSMNYALHAVKGN